MIIEHGDRNDFKRCVAGAIPDMPKVGDYYLYGTSTFQVTNCAEDGWMTMKNILHDSNNPNSCGGMSTSIYGVYNLILKGKMLKLLEIDLNLYDMGRMYLQRWPEEGSPKDFKRVVLNEVWNRECGICFSRDVAEAEDDLVMGCPRCAQVSYAAFNDPLP